jgi:hypothetical protein
MAALSPKFKANQLGTSLEFDGKTLSSSNLFLFNEMKINPILRRLYGFGVENKAKCLRNSFAETTLRKTPMV